MPKYYLKRENGKIVGSAVEPSEVKATRGGVEVNRMEAMGFIQVPVEQYLKYEVDKRIPKVKADLQAAYDRSPESFRSAYDVIVSRIPLIEVNGLLIKNLVKEKLPVESFYEQKPEDIEEGEEMLAEAIENGYVSHPGGGYYYPYGSKDAIRGKEAIIQYLRTHPYAPDEA